ncbi:MAG: hypothetical protein WD801_03095 [Gemmatimonadaceae bacterium]
MMAFDRTPAGPALDPTTIAELREALSRSVEAGDHGKDLKSLLGRAAVNARSKGIQAEQMLIALKEIWYSVPSLSAHPASDVQTRLLEQLIALCIQEYYAG